MPVQTRKRKAAEPAKPTAKKAKTVTDETSLGSKSVEKPEVNSERKGKGSTFKITNDVGKDITCELWESQGECSRDRPMTLIFTHGAGGGIANVATQLFATGFSETTPIVLFEGNMNLKSRTKYFQDTIDHVKKTRSGSKRAVGGSSMGARAAVMAAQDNPDVTHLVLVSYPLMNEKGDKRDKILLDLPAGKEVLFISGSKDSMCDIKELETLRKKMKAKSNLVIVSDADHGLMMTKVIEGRSKATSTTQIRQAVGRKAADWLGNPNEFESTLRLDMAIDESAMAKDV